ncbi:Ger(x)C family spore germination protein [Paenibacillus sp. YAF4_2]|uniref:Ger(x)C family spore germination protein n=1 Tax=Paenibacillus sp. YAF4_2 TaxID=3233085 RepID=UPI003F9E6AEC
MSPRKIYNSHLRILVIQEDLAREGVNDVLDYVSRNHEHRTDFYIVVARKTSAASTLKVLTHLEAIPANQMYYSLSASQKAWGHTSTMTLDMLIRDIVSEGKSPVLTGIRYRGPQEVGKSKQNVEEISSPAILVYTGLGVFRKDKLIGWLSEEDSRNYSFIHDDIDSTVLVIPCPSGGKLSLEVIRFKTKIKSSLTGDNPAIKLTSRTEVNIGEVKCRIDLTKLDTINELQTIASEQLQTNMEKTIKKVQQTYGVDIFGFGDAFHRSYPKYWHKVTEQWETFFPSLPVTVKVDLQIREIGTLNNSFMEQKQRE